MNLEKIINKIKIYLLLEKIKKANFNNIFILNVAGYNNFGDDLIALYIYKRILKINKNVYQIVDKNNHSVNNNLLNLGLKIMDISTYQPKNDLIIIGGGTLLNPFVFGDYFIKQADNYIKRGFHVSYLGIETTGLINKFLAKKILRKCFFIAVRNKESKKIMNSLYFKEKKPNILVIGDLVEQINFSKAKNKKNIVGICISPKIELDEEILKKILLFLISKKYKVEFFSFCNHLFAEHERDNYFAKKFINKYFKNHQKIRINKETNMGKVLENMNKFKFIITTRFHATIIAKEKKITVFNVNYEDKCINYCRKNNIFNGDLEDLYLKFRSSI